MEFLKHLKNYLVYLETDRYSSINDTIQMSHNIIFNNNIELSIQGSRGHYCIPKENIDYDKYTHMEVALLKNGNFVRVNKLVSLLPEEDTYKDHYNGCIYSFVPVKEIEKLYQELKRRYGLKETL